MSETTTATRVYFQPYVAVELPTGKISIDWSDCETNAVDSEGNEVDVPVTDDGYSVAAKILDEALGIPADDSSTPAGTAAVLRRLADYIERGQ